jgi:pyruvate/2-oxoglutarate dehydrogenase complex dihydrolipoamide acyltransferase (E2) component
MQVPITMPELGTRRAELSVWFVDLGARVEEGERLLEILAGAATVDLAAPASGRLVKQCAFPPDSVLPGQVLGYIENHIGTS